MMLTGRHSIVINPAQTPARAGGLGAFAPRLLIMLAAVLIGLGPWAASVARAQPTSPSAAKAAMPAKAVVAKAPVATPSIEEQKSFHERMLTVPTPHRGCFVARYPTPTWKETPCAAAPRTPSPQHRGALPNTVGAGTDFFSQVTGHLSGATGSFDSATGITKEYGSKGNTLTTVYPDVYELQMNSNVYTAPCPTAGGCSGWEQFLFSQTQCSGACVFIEYWLLNYPPPCPSGSPWTYYAGTPTTTPGCYFNTNGTSVPVQALSDFGKLRLSATVANGNDEVQLTVADGTVYKQSNASVANLANGWTGAEYNVFGDCCASHIYFTGAPATLVVRQAVSNGSTSAPTCTSSFNGTTAETNNLNLVGACATSGGSAPAIVFTESGGGSLPPGVSIGDPHLTTFQSAHYNFMEVGEYLLVQSDPDLVVQARQALISPPGAPAVAQNVALAVKMGPDQVSIYPNSLEVNGKVVALPDTHAIALHNGAQVGRAGALLTVSRPSGDIIQGRQIPATSSFPAHVDITVNLGGGTDPSKVRGLLVSSTSAQHPVTLRTGVAVKAPVLAADLHTYAESWRIQAAESMFHAEGRPTPSGLLKPLTVGALDQAKRTAARQVCQKAGVSGATALDDCTLDVAATGDDTAAASFVYQPKTKTVIGPK